MSHIFDYCGRYRGYYRLSNNREAASKYLLWYSDYRHTTKSRIPKCASYCISISAVQYLGYFASGANRTSPKHSVYCPHNKFQFIVIWIWIPSRPLMKFQISLICRYFRVVGNQKSFYKRMTFLCIVVCLALIWTIQADLGNDNFHITTTFTPEKCELKSAAG